MKLPKISNNDIRSGEVMGPILVVIFIVLAVVWFIASITDKIGFWPLLWGLTAFAGVLWFWFSALPRLWNWFVDIVTEQPPEWEVKAQAEQAKYASSCRSAIINDTLKDLRSISIEYVNSNKTGQVNPALLSRLERMAKEIEALATEKE